MAGWSLAKSVLILSLTQRERESVVFENSGHVIYRESTYIEVAYSSTSEQRSTDHRVVSKENQAEKAGSALLRCMNMVYMLGIFVNWYLILQVTRHFLEASLINLSSWSSRQDQITILLKE